jgi:septum formation protein
MRLVLASTSPRRKELLGLLGYSFDVCAPTFVERLSPDRSADMQAREFARNKALSCAPRFSDHIILGSDTVIDMEGTVIGKPGDVAEARAMLRSLMGREHRVCTAVAVLAGRKSVPAVATETVRVWMKQWDDERLTAYLGTGESLGKAGAYSIQGEGGELIERIEGDFTAAVGLPLRLTASMLDACGMGPLIDIDALYRARPYPNWSRFAL